MYNVEVATKSGTSFLVKTQGHELIIDSEEKAGIAPMSILLSGLGACIGVYIRKYASGTKLEIKEFAISLRAELCKEHPIRFKTIELPIDFKGLVLDDMRKNSLIEFVKNCPVHNTLAVKPEVNIKLL